MDKIEGYLQIGTNDAGEVVMNLPGGKTGHIVFSVNQARALAHTLLKQAVIAERVAIVLRDTALAEPEDVAREPGD
jgi:hypothetical protein